MLPVCSYRDVYVEVDGARCRLNDLPANYILQCTKVAGWQLWRRNGRFNPDEDAVVAAEFARDDEGNAVPFRLWFGDNLIFDTSLLSEPLDCTVP